MSECPDNPTPASCGFAGAQFVVERSAHGSPYISLEPLDTLAPLKIAPRANVIRSLLKLREVRGDGASNLAVFTCTACSKCIEIVEDSGELTARIAQPLGSYE